MTNYSELELEMAFNAGRKYESGELELDTEGKETAFDVWFETFNVDEDK